MTRMAHGLHTETFCYAPESPLQLESHAEIATCWIRLSKKSSTIESHSAAGAISVPLRRASELHLKVQRGGPFGVDHLYDSVIVLNLLFQLVLVKT